MKPTPAFFSFLVTAAAWMAPDLWAQTGPSVEERLRTLEQQVRDLANENASLKQQLGAKEVVAPVLPQPGGHENRLVVGGFLQGQSEFGRVPDPRWNGINDRFFFRRARIYLAGVFAEDFDFKAELDLQGNSLSASTGLTARANEIYLGWHKYSFANLRFGQRKPAYGAEALSSDTKTFTIERSISSDRLTDGRQLGFEAAGDLFGRKVGYLAMVSNGNGANVSSNDNNKFQKSARLTYTPLFNSRDRVAFGVDGLWSEDVGLVKPDFGFTGNQFTGKRAMAGVDAVWTHGPFDLTAELLRGTFQPADAHPAAKFDATGWQATAAYFLIRARLQAVAQYVEFDPNTSIADNTIRTHTFGLNYYVVGEDLKIMLNYIDGHVPGSLTDGGRLLARITLIF